MKIYFVRHGETEYNLKGLYQHKDVELSEKGKKQAEFLKKRFLKIKVDAIISSSYKRAGQTAEIINKDLNKKILYAEEFVEKKWPKEVVGKEYEDPKAIEYKKAAAEKIHDSEWHYSDEENHFDFQARISRAVNLLENREEDILVVSHGGTIRAIVLQMMFGNGIDPQTYLKGLNFFKSSNTGITLCEKNDKGKWQLLIWNDHAHLG